MSEAFWRWVSRIGHRLSNYGYDQQERVLRKKLRRLQAQVGNHHSNVEG